MSGDSAMDNVARRETTRAIAAKERGNALFKDRRFEAAAAQYSLALGLAPPVCELRTEIPDLAQVRAACLSNRAAAFLSLGWHAHAVLDASACLAEIAFVPKNPQLEKLRTKVHRRRARAYEALGFARRAALDHARAARKARSKLEDAPEGAASSADDGGSAVAAGEAVSPWNVREDWATFVEAYLSAADLGRLRRVNRSWKAGVESNDEAWREAEVSVHGAFERVAVAKRAHIAQSSAPVAVALGPPLEHVPRVVHALLGRPPPIVIDFGTGYTKAGFAGLPTPSCMVGNFTVRNRLQQEVQVVDMGGRIAVDGASLVQFLNAAVFEPLHVDPAYHPVVMVVSSHSQAAAACLQGEQNRGQTDLRRSEEESIQRVATTLRREFGVPAVKVVHSAEAAMHRAGLETGVIVDIGLGMTRACPVVNGKVVSAGIQAQFIGAANVTNLLLHELRSRPELLDAFSQMSGFEVMLCVKGMKEEQLTVASSTEEALSQRPCTTEMRALSAATGQKLYCRCENSLVFFLNFLLGTLIVCQDRLGTIVRNCAKKESRCRTATNSSGHQRSFSLRHGSASRECDNLHQPVGRRFNQCPIELFIIISYYLTHCWLSCAETRDISARMHRRRPRACTSLCDGLQDSSRRGYPVATVLPRCLSAAMLL
jgi:hypothetical protein